MMVMTAKVDMKKILLGLAAVAALVLSLILLLGGGEPTAQTAASPISNNDQRVQFLTELGWSVTTSPAQSSQVKIPDASSQAFDRYNTLQKSQGYDLSQFAGKKVMRYVYKINNFPGASTEPVYATLLVHKNQIIGGDITDTAPGGRIQGFKPAQVPPPSSAPTESTVTQPTLSPGTAY